MERTLEEINAEIAATKEEIKSVKGTQTEVYARIVGYYRAVRNWNKGKRQEFDERVMFEVEDNKGSDKESSKDSANDVKATNKNKKTNDTDKKPLLYSVSNQDLTTTDIKEKSVADKIATSKAQDKKMAELAKETLESIPPTISTPYTSLSYTYSKNLQPHYELFTKETCPNCPPVKSFMSTVNMKGLSVNLDTEAGLSFAMGKGVFISPTVIFYDKDNKEIKRFHDVEELETSMAHSYSKKSA